MVLSSLLEVLKSYRLVLDGYCVTSDKPTCASGVVPDGQITRRPELAAEILKMIMWAGQVLPYKLSW